MDYEKEYNHAFEIAKGYWGGVTDFVRGILESMFPQLAESEDEKIMKEIIEFLDYCYDTNLFREEDYNNQYIWRRWLEKQKEQKPIMIQWTGKNLKEVIDFTGKSPRFGEWFNSWDEYENYVHTHNNILKLFCEDGSHFEVPVGAWIIKTPDGHNVPSVARFIHAKQEQQEVDLEDNIRVEFGTRAKIEGGKRYVKLDWDKFGILAYHFYALGQQSRIARKEE